MKSSFDPPQVQHSNNNNHNTDNSSDSDNDDAQEKASFLQAFRRSQPGHSTTEEDAEHSNRIRRVLQAPSSSSESSESSESESSETDLNQSQHQNDNDNTDDDDMVVPLTQCEACGHMVPEPNVTIHRLHACAGVARLPPTAAAVTHTSSSSDEEPMDVDDEHENENEEEEDSKLPAPTQSNNHNSRRFIDLSRSPPGSPDLPPSSRRRGGPSSKRARNHHNHNPTTPPEVVDLSADTPQRSRSDEDEAEWACPQCTLLNRRADSSCNACGLRNPNAPPDPTVREQLIPTESPFSSSRMIGGGALLGGIVGAAGNYLRGRSVLEGSMSGAMSGAVGGAVLNDVMTSNSHSRSNEQQQHIPGRPTYRVTHRDGSNNNNVASARSSAALGTPGYPSLTTSSSSQSSRRPRPSYRVTQRTSSNGRAMTTTVSGGSGITRVTTRSTRSGRVGDSINDPMIQLMLHSLMEERNQHGHQHHASHNQPNVDGMNYEQLLQRFGDGSEHLGADEARIQQMPTSIVTSSTELPEDSSQCLICLEDFEQGDARMTLPCLHNAFHQACAEQWLRTNGSCPICKHRI